MRTKTKKSIPKSKLQEADSEITTPATELEVQSNNIQEIDEERISIEGLKAGSPDNEGFVANGAEIEGWHANSTEYEIEVVRDNATQNCDLQEIAEVGNEDTKAHGDEDCRDGGNEGGNVEDDGVGNGEDGTDEEDPEEGTAEDSEEEEDEENEEGGEEENEELSAEDDDEENNEDNEEVSTEDGDEEDNEENDEFNVEHVEEEQDEDVKEDAEDAEDDEFCSDVVYTLLPDRRKEKELEIFIGGLHKDTVEEDLIEIFGKFGEISIARIAKHLKTNKSKGFAFIQYATAEQTERALSELKHGIEVKGKHAKISLSQGNNTLYIGNICKTWTKEHVLEKLKDLGIEEIEEIYLPEDPKSDGKIKGFAFLGFCNHSDAMAALQQLRKADAVFGRDSSAKVAFAQTPLNPRDGNLSQVRTVYVGGLSDSWDKAKLKRICGLYGDIEKVMLSHDLRSKRKDFGFVTFKTRENALACVQGLNNDQIDGEVKVNAMIVRPHFKGRLPKQRSSGGFKESFGEAGFSQTNAHPKSSSKSRKKKRKAALKKEEKPTSNEKVFRGKLNPIPASDSAVEDVAKSSKSTKHQKKSLSLKLEGPKKQLKDDGHKKQLKDHGHKEISSKRPWGKKVGKQSYAIAKHSKSHLGRGLTYSLDSAEYGNLYAQGYAARDSSYPIRTYGALSGYKRRSSDMEPHAGYIEPTARKRASTYSGSAFGVHGRRQAGYIDSVSMQHQALSALRRTSGHEGFESQHGVYSGGSTPLPAYVPEHHHLGYGGAYTTSAYYYSGGSDSLYPPH
ncbi:hypothetical protein Nepgr_021547 [Nepenthes gracilis]|uniref:RRM domain-containing protein n=1 Tax=Nepenthes gracilis TaxID=150966 RepID=A0AAD3SZ94_NEPGR|nr:hypothetical protein Nepgr_021547 [Nepenthes gracilis]